MTEQEKIQLLKDMVNINTTNGNELELAKFLAEVFSKYGIESNILNFTDTRANLIVEIGSGDKVLGVSGHMDVVDPGNLENWKTDPFEATMIDRELYGRGSNDMKGGLAALVIAMIELFTAKADLNIKVRLLATVGEEIGELGAEQLTKLGYADDLSGLIIAEPSGYSIVYAHKGSINYTVESFGKNSHSSLPEEGINAINNLSKFQNKIVAYTDNVSVVSEDLGKFTNQITIINGGNQVNSVPEYAKLQGNMRTIPELDNEQVKKDFQAIIDELNKEEQVDLRITWDFDKIPVQSDKNSRLVTLSQEVTKEIVDIDVKAMTIAATTDAAEFTKSKNQFPVIIYGPGNETAHQVNEHINVDNYLQMIEVYKQIMLRF